MEKTSLTLAATYIIARNVTPNVSAAVVEWEQERRCLGLRYLFDAVPDEEDVSAMELSMAELLAEFPDVAKAETRTTVGPLGPSDAGTAVYVRAQTLSG